MVSVVGCLVLDGAAHDLLRGLLSSRCRDTGVCMTIRIPYPLVRSWEKQGAPDQQFRRRMNLADRIQSCADPALLGPHFRQVHLVPLFDAAGPSLAVFTFQSVPGVDAGAQVIDLIPLVSTFVEALTDL